MADFEIGDLAWAKMKGFSPWPAMIVEPIADVKPPKAKELSYYVRFFGTNDHSWILASNIFSYEENKDKYAKKSLSGTFKKAVEEITEYAEQHPQTKRTSNTPKANGFATPKKAIQMINNKRLSKTKSPKLSPEKRGRKDSHGSTPKKRRTSGSSNTSSSSNKVDNKKVPKYFVDIETPPNSKSGQSSSYFWADNPSSTPKSTGLLERPSVPSVEYANMDITKGSDILMRKHVVATQKVVGFLGLSLMGKGIVKNLIHSRHKVVIWSQIPDECEPFIKLGATHKQTPGDVVRTADITFSCVDDPEASKAVFFSSCGVLQAISRDKGYIEMTSIDPGNSEDIANAIISKEGRYLEAPILGSKTAADIGTLNILAAGDRILFDECRSCFEAMGERVFFLGDVGKAAKMNLVINVLAGTTYAALGECLNLAKRSEISQRDVLEILKHGPMKCPTIIDNGHFMMEELFNDPNMPLHIMQRNLQMALNLGDKWNQQLPTVSAANELYKHAKSLGYGQLDVSAIYQGVRF